MKIRYIIASAAVRSQPCRLRCLGLGPGSFRDIFPAQGHHHLRRGRRQGRERRHPRHRPVAALCRQPANSGERRSTVARGRALPPGIVQAASAADLAVWGYWCGRRRFRRRWFGGGGRGGAAVAVLAAAVRVAAVGPRWRAGTMKPSRFAADFDPKMMTRNHRTIDWEQGRGRRHNV